MKISISYTHEDEVLGLSATFDIEGRIQDGSPRTRDYPGDPATVEITSIILASLGLTNCSEFETEPVKMTEIVRTAMQDHFYGQIGGNDKLRERIENEIFEMADSMAMDFV